MKISLVMTTYNGSKYIENQLNSIFNQTLKPDEVVIMDDCSTDNTCEIIERFISNNNLIRWKLIKSSSNVGWKRNFYNAINKATGDIIFLSDQDDIWKKNKIEVIVQAFKKEKKAELFVSNYDTKYIGKDNVIIKNSKKHIGKDYISNINLSGTTFEIIRPGCTMAFKKEMLDYFNIIWESDFAHDAVLWMISVFRNTAFIINEELIIQIRHDGNSTPSNEKTRERRIIILKNRKNLAQKILNNKEILKIREIQLIEKYILFMNERIRILEKKSVIKWILLFRYIDLYPKFESWIGDILSMFR